MKKTIYLLLVFFCSLFVSFSAHAEIDPDSLLPADEAFIPQLFNSDNGLSLQFTVADGYYLYKSKIEFITEPEVALQAASYSPAITKEDDFFGKQEVYYRNAVINIPYQTPYRSPFQLKLSYQGCADVGICYPPVETTFSVENLGLINNNSAAPPKGFNFKSGNSGMSSPVPKKSDAHGFTLSWDTLSANLLAFFIAGLGLSFTACMYPLLPIVSSIVVGDKSSSKKRAFLLSMVYVQGLALTYTIVGVIAGLTGALLTVWLQQAWVVLSASILMVVLALGMFGMINIQLPSAIQAYFQNQSSRLSGGKIASVFGMGMMSALIIGPCVAPPLALALGYIGSTGDGSLGGLALYALALGTGAPLVFIGTFGAHFLPKAGNWMNGIKYFFGAILLAVAVYLATPFIPYIAAVLAYAAIVLGLGSALIYAGLQAKTAWLAVILGIAINLFGLYFAIQGINQKSTILHEFVTLIPETGEHKARFKTTEELNNAIATAFKDDASKPVLVDFYADWCVTCKEMEAKTLSQESVHNTIDMDRFFTIDVTDNTPEQQALLKEYGLFGPPGIFVLNQDGTRSKPLLGFAPADEFIQWYQEQTQQ